MNERTSIPDHLASLPRSWGEAKETGAKLYCSGKPCPKCGNIDARRYPRGKCLTCEKAENRARGQQQRDMARSEREAARAAKAAAEAAERQKLIDILGLDVVQGYEEASRIAAEIDRRERSRQSSRKSRAKKMKEVGTENTRAQDNKDQRDWYARTRPARLAARRERTARGVAGYRMIRLRTPPWLTAEELAEIDAIYASRKKGEEVDHLVPIDSHDELAGIHVPWNLRVITRPKNRQRSKGRADEFRCTAAEAEDYVAQGMAVWKRDMAPDGTIDWSKYPRPTR